MNTPSGNVVGSPNHAAAQERKCFGCTVDEMKRSLEPQAKLGGWSMLVMSMMSDVQEMVDRGYPSEDIRQLLNRTKWAFATHVAKRDEHGRMA